MQVGGGSGVETGEVSGSTYEQKKRQRLGWSFFLFFLGNGSRRAQVQVARSAATGWSLAQVS